MEKPNAGGLSITLVHGTWGRGIFFPTDKPWWGEPYWFDQESAFRQRLGEELEKRKVSHQIDCIDWSGSNSIFEREKAVEKLRVHLSGTSQAAFRVVIGHSHGGNIILRAVSELNHNNMKFHLVTLATPFLRLYPRWSGQGFWRLFFISFVAIAFAFLLAIFGNWIPLEPPSIPADILSKLTSETQELLKSRIWISPFSELVAQLFGTGISPESAMRFALFSYIAIAILSAVLSVLAVRIYFNPEPRQRPDPLHRPWAWRPFILAEKANYHFADNSIPPLLVIRGVGDEASLTMAAGKIGERISYFFASDLLLPFFFLSLVAEIFIAMGAKFLFSYLNSATVIVAIAFVIFPFLPNAFNAIFGRELFLGATRCEVAADSVPDGMLANVVTLEPLGPNSGGLRHSVYNDPDCVVQIINWLEAEGVVASAEAIKR